MYRTAPLRLSVCLSLMSAFTFGLLHGQSLVCAPLQATATIDCNTQTVQLSVDTSYTSYQWSPSSGLSNDTIPNPVATAAGTYSVTATYSGPNLVINPDFAAGNSGFNSGMNFTTVYSPCDYWVGAQWFQNYFPGLTDHTPTTDNMFMMIDGCTTPTMIWEETNFTVIPGADYDFSFWATESGANQPTFEIHFIGNVTGDVIVASPVGIPAPTNSTWMWDPYGVPLWNAGANSSVTVRIINLATQGYGVDFGMDDFDFHRVCTSTDTVQVVLPLAVNLGPDIALCDVSNVTLNAGSGGTYLWNTGATTQTITPGVAGIYSVSFDDGLCITHDTIVVTNLPVPVVDLGNDTAACDVSALILDAGQGGTYLWNTGATTQTVSPTLPGTYWVSYDNGYCISYDTIVITALPPVSVNLGTDISLCDVSAVVLDAGVGGSYFWNTGATTQTITPGVAGIYWVFYSNGSCIDSDTIIVTSVTTEPVSLGEDLLLCQYDFLQLDAGAGDSYLWNNGANTETIAPQLAGTYFVTVTNGNCTSSDTIELVGDLGESILFIPNTITPDGNALNDVFFVYGSDITEFRMRIFNRWGELLFETNDPAAGWNGTYKGTLVEEDTYVYVIDYSTMCGGDTRKRTGHVNVIR
jgi:gliding motility-associated-like protein